MKKILSLVLVMVLVLSCSVPVMATGGSTSVSEDTQVQAAYDAYKEVQETLNLNEYGLMKDAFEKYTEITDAFTDEQSEEWNKIVYEVIGIEDALGTLVDAATVIYALEKQSIYLDNPNSKTAYDYVTAYDECKNAGINIELFEAGAEAVYEMAKTDMPSDDVLAVYDAYQTLKDVLMFGYYDEDFIVVCEEFEAILDVLNELTEEEWNDMAFLMEAADGEEAFSKVLTDWIDANIILEMGKAYDDFWQDANTETAVALVEVYERVFGATDFYTEEEFKLFRLFFSDIDSVYEEAKSLIAPDDGSSEDQGKEDNNEDAGKTEDTDKANTDKDAVPKTGDDAKTTLYMALMLAAVGVVCAVYRKKKVY